MFDFATDQLSGNISVVNGNCASGSCLNLRPAGGGETVTLTRSGGGTFSVTQFWFQLLGTALDNTLRITSSSGATTDYPASTWGFNDGGQTVMLGSGFEDIVSMTFTNLNRGSIRIDDIEVEYEMTPVPLPAAGWLLLVALGGLAAIRRQA